MNKMKLIKINTDHYVVVDDSEIKEGDWYVHNQKGVGLRVQKCIGTNLPMDSKKITHSTQPLGIGWQQEVIELSLKEVKELIGEVDVEKKANECIANVKHNGSYIRGYNQALEDNKEKKYTEEDLIEILKLYDNHIQINFGPSGKIQSPKEFIQSLQPKTKWEVEWETIDNRQPCDCSCHNNPNMVHFVACCNNGWIGTVTQKLKLK